MVKDAGYWIEKLELAEHPEGGFYRRIYRSPEVIHKDCLPERYGGARTFSTSIVYLLQGSQFSALHRIKSDEVWHFYAGSSLTLHVIDGVGSLSLKRLGQDPEKGEAFQEVVEAGCWFGATVDDSESYTLLGCTVAPGFEFDDFELGDRQALTDLYPQHQFLIEKLTR